MGIIQSTNIPQTLPARFKNDEIFEKKKAIANINNVTTVLEIKEQQ